MGSNHSETIHLDQRLAAHINLIILLAYVSHNWHHRKVAWKYLFLGTEGIGNIF